MATQLLADWRAQAARTIAVDSARVQRLTALYRVQMGTDPTRRELDHLIETFIRDEILYREALKLGLHRDDEIVRRRLVQKMEFLISDLLAPEEPPVDELLAFHQRHAARFSPPATASFAHIYFSADADGDAAARLAAEGVLSKLAGKDGTVASQHGDPFPLHQDYAGLSRSETERLFGRTPFAAAVFSAGEDRWQGPYRSGYGWHLLFVHQRAQEALLPFSEVEAQVRRAYLDEQRSAANEERLAALRTRYAVLRAESSTETP